MTFYVWPDCCQVKRHRAGKPMRSQQTFTPISADLILTRNAGGEAFNESPGHYNHAAICDRKNVIEAQAHTRDGRISDDPTDPGSVIVTPWEEILARYPEIVVRRFPDLTDFGRDRIAAAAVAMVGMAYAIGASLFRRRARRRHWRNCVSVCRFAYEDGIGQDFAGKCDSEGREILSPLSKG